jgi:predicted DNA-binding transcriptional regulator AlpA
MGFNNSNQLYEENMNKRLVGQKEAAQYLNLSEATMERDRWRGGNIPYIRIGPRAIKYDLEQLDEYIDRNTVQKNKAS